MIFGASGQDGTLMRKKLGNTKVVNVSSRPIQKEPNAKEINVIIESYNMSNLTKLLLEHKPNVVINFTGLSSVAECDNFPHRSLDLNFQVVENLVQSLIDSKMDNYTFVQCSSSEMFGLGKLLCNEEREMNPVTTYGKHKLKASEFLSSEIPDNLLNLILFNHESEFRTENFVTKKIINGVRSFKNTGLQTELGNVNSARDWSYAPDFIVGILKLIAAEKHGKFVFGSGTSHTVKDFAKLAMKFANVNEDFEEVFKIDANLFRTVETPPLLADTTKYNAEFSKLAKSSFERMVEKIIFNSTAS